MTLYFLLFCALRKLQVQLTKHFSTKSLAREKVLNESLSLTNSFCYNTMKHGHSTLHSTGITLVNSLYFAQIVSFPVQRDRDSLQGKNESLIHAALRRLFLLRRLFAKMALRNRESSPKSAPQTVPSTKSTNPLLK